MPCPLCHHHHTRWFFRDSFRDYFCCSQCSLVYVPPEFHLDPAREKARYDTHRNDPSDVGYRRFLSRLSRPLQTFVSPGSHGLDFGSGPGPTLSVMLEEAGYRMTLYDRYYAPYPNLLAQVYDFITATEVVEHVRDLAGDLDQVWACLRPDGFLGIMTKLVRNQDAFTRWHYIRDPTHIAFFSHQTFTWLARSWGAKVVYQENDVIILHKPLARGQIPCPS